MNKISTLQPLVFLTRAFVKIIHNNKRCNDTFEPLLVMDPPHVQA